MAEPLFDEVVRHSRLAEYRKTKAAERVVSALSPRLLQHIQDVESRLEFSALAHIGARRFSLLQHLAIRGKVLSADG